MLLNKLRDTLAGYHGAVDAYAFTEVNKVGRGVETDLVARLAEDGGQEMGDGAFAIGSGNMDGAEATLGVAEVLHEGDCVGDVGLVGCLAYAMVHGQAVEEVV